VLHGLKGKGYLESQVVVQIEDVIKERETNVEDLNLPSPEADTEMADFVPSHTIPRAGKRGPQPRLDKRQVEQRIEEDRERHKRERESIWATPSADGAEQEKLWDETSDFGDDDDRLIDEEEADFVQEMEMQRCHHQKSANGAAHRN
jgi:CTD kinase subunit gamma